MVFSLISWGSGKIGGGTVAQSQTVSLATDSAALPASGEALVDDAAFTPGTSKVVPAGLMFDDTAPDSVNEGDIGVQRMSANRNGYVTVRDAAGNERGLNVAADGTIGATSAQLPAALGQAAMAASLPVVIANNQSVLPVSEPRSGIVEGTLALGQTTYGANVCVGNRFEIATGLAAGTIIRPNLFSVWMLATGTTGQTLFANTFNADPTGSTTNDNTTFALVAADVGKFARQHSPGASTQTGGVLVWTPSMPNRIAVDAAGKIYVSLVSSAASLVVPASSVLNWRLEYGY